MCAASRNAWWPCEAGAAPRLRRPAIAGIRRRDRDESPRWFWRLERPGQILPTPARTDAAWRLRFHSKRAPREPASGNQCCRRRHGFRRDSEAPGRRGGRGTWKHSRLWPGTVRRSFPSTVPVPLPVSPGVAGSSGFPQRLWVRRRRVLASEALARTEAARESPRAHVAGRRSRRARRAAWREAQRPEPVALGASLPAPAWLPAAPAGFPGPRPRRGAPTEDPQPERKNESRSG